MKLILSTILVFLLTSAPILAGETYYVAVTGSNAGEGNEDDPWRDISYAISELKPGDTIVVRDGTYKERIIIPATLQGDELTTIRCVKGAIVTIDGRDLGTEVFEAGIDDYSPDGDKKRRTRGLVEIHGRNVLLQGFRMTEFWATDPSHAAVGILVKPGAEDVAIEDCHIHGMGSKVTPVLEYDEGEPGLLEFMGRDAHGILVQSKRGGLENGIRRIFIRKNQLYNLQLGSSEALVVNGNVEDFEISRNTIRNCDNIGIDIIGYEGNLEEADRARKGDVFGNTVENCTTAENPSYQNRDPDKFPEAKDNRGPARTCPGIYVDGGLDITLAGNTVVNCDYGIEVTSERKDKFSEKITITSNVLRNNYLSGVTIGGSENENGGIINCLFINNTLVDNDRQRDDWNGQVQIQHHIVRTKFINNIFTTAVPTIDRDEETNKESKVYVLLTDARPKKIAKESYKSGDLSFSHNIYFSLDLEQSMWDHFDSWGDFRKNGQSELFTDPKFSDIEKGDFTPALGSPARESGLGHKKVGAKDCTGNPRVIGTIDRGAFESN